MISHGIAPSPRLPPLLRPRGRGKLQLTRWLPAALAVSAGRVARGGLRFHEGEVVKSLPGFVEVNAEVVDAICSFAELRKNDPVVTWITGKRVQVYLSGKKSQAFRDYVEEKRLSDVSKFLTKLKQRLAEVAQCNGGEASEDILALVGASEMQVPHTDLLPGQVQVILALSPTTSTLVYDPRQPRPSRDEVARIMDVPVDELQEDGDFGLVYKSFPLVLPVKHLYQHMVESYDAAFGPGDAVQIQDGIVHAGPACDEAGKPRVVIFMTYRTFREDHYEFTFQAKLWDWASHPSIPPMTAYARLREVYEFSLEQGMDIKPWTYYPPQSLEACKMLCTTPQLDEMTVELLVEEWRGMLYDEEVQIVSQDQEKDDLLA